MEQGQVQDKKSTRKSTRKASKTSTGNKFQLFEKCCENII